MEKCTNRLCNCHRMTTSTAGQKYFTHYESPNIVIVPTVSFINCTTTKNSKLSDESQNSIHTNKVPIIQDNHMNSEVSSINDNSASVKNNKTAKIKNSSWASNYLQSIGQPELSTSSMSNNTYICIPDRNPEKINTKNIFFNKKQMTQCHVNNNMELFGKGVEKTDDIHNRVTSLLSSIIPGTRNESREKKANTLLTTTLSRANQTTKNANSGKNITIKLLKHENTNNSITKRKHDTEKNNINEYSPTIKRVNKARGVNDSNIQLKPLHSNSDNHDGKPYKEKEIISTPNVHCKYDSFDKKSKPSKDIKSVSSSSYTSCKTVKDIKQKTGLKKPCFKCTSNHKSEQNRKAKQKINKFKNAGIIKVSQDSRNKKSKEKSLEETCLKKDKRGVSSKLDIKDGAKSTSENQDTVGKVNTKKCIKSVVQTTNSYDFNIISKNNYEQPHEIEDLRIKLNRSHCTKRRDHLLVTVPNTNDHQNETMQMQHSSEHPKVKTIKLVINLICNKTKNTKIKEDNKKNEKRQLANVDLSFLDDFNVDDIVESLNYDENTRELPSADNNQSVTKTAEPSYLITDIKERVKDVEIESMCSRDISKQTENVTQSSVNNNIFIYCDECKVKKLKVKNENEKEMQLDITNPDKHSKKTIITSKKLNVHDTITISKTGDINSNAVIDKDIKGPYEVRSENTDGCSKYTNTKEEIKVVKYSNTETITSKINNKTSVKLEEVTPNIIASSIEITSVDNKYKNDNSNAVIYKDIIIIEDTYENRNEIIDDSSKYTKQEIKDSKIQTIGLNDNTNINNKTSVKLKEVLPNSNVTFSKLTLVNKNYNNDNNSNAVIDKDIILIEDTYENRNANTVGDREYTKKKIKYVKDSNNKIIELNDISKINNKTSVKLKEVTPNKISGSSELTSIHKNYNLIESAKIDSPKCTPLLTVKTSESTTTLCDSQLQENKMIKQELNENIKEPNNKDTGKLDMVGDFKVNVQVDNKSCRGSCMSSANSIENNLEVLNRSSARNDLSLAHLDTEILKNSKNNNPSDSFKSQSNDDEIMSSFIKSVSAATEVQVQDQNKSELEETKKSTVNSAIGIEETSVSKDLLNSPLNPYDVVLKELLETRMHQYFRMKYDIRSLIHTGKYSKIFHCKDSHGDSYAVKVLNITNDRYSRAIRIRKEDMIKSLQQDIPKENLNCIFLIDGFAIKNHWCFLMDYYPKDLKQVLKEQKGFHICMVQKLSRQLVLAVMVLRNNNIVHSDIKPGHILLNGSLDRLKICGFDGYRHVDQVTLLPSIGTASYRAPEIILGYSDGFTVDVWSTALVMFEMATSWKLFPGVFNNDILFQQMCMLGNIPFEMIQTSLYKEHHYCGSCFKRRTGYKGKSTVLVSKFNKTPHNISSAVFKAYHKYYGESKTKLEKIQDSKLIKSFLQLLEQMLVLDPKRRLPIEFVYANEFIYN